MQKRRVFLCLCVSFCFWLEFFSLQSRAQSGSPPAPLAITLEDAIARARANHAEFREAATQAGLAREDRVQARNAYDEGEARFRQVVANLQTLTGGF
jgi:hypothetical protein